MSRLLLRLYFRLHDLVTGEDGQDLVEYGLVIGLIAFGAVTGMTSMAGAINTAFGNISGTLGTSIV